jgi:hypothetical protein
MDALLKNCKRIMLAVVFVFVIFIIGHRDAKAEEDLRIYFSGILKNADNALADSGSYDMRFILYNGATSTNAIWQEEFLEENKVPIVSGRFQVILGSQTPLVLNFENARYYLSIMVENLETGLLDSEMTPRIPVTTLENLFFDGSIEFSQEDFIQKLVEAFEQSATSTENLTQEAFLKFLQERLTQSEATAVIISPTTLNLLFNKIVDYQGDKTQIETNGILGTVLNFFQRILETIANALTQITNKISAIFDKMAAIDDKTTQILNIVNQGSSATTTTAIAEKTDSEFNVNFLVEDFGETVISQGSKSVRVFSSYLTPNAKIFVTPNSTISGIWWISDRKSGESFEISILAPAEEDLRLDYWIVTPKEEMLTVFPLPVLEESENADIIEEKQKELINQDAPEGATTIEETNTETIPAAEENINLGGTTSESITSETANSEN